jgi:methionyl aminopeptidase
MRPKTAAEIDFMRAGGQQLAKILNLLGQKVEAGVSGREISGIAAVEIKAAGLVPVLLGFQGFPDVICISLNEAVVHGIPSKEPFKDGDVVKLDLTVSHRSMIIDAATTVVVGSNISGDVRRLVNGSKKALELGIGAIHGDGTRVGDIASAIQNELNRNHLGIVRDLVGHGVGYSVHEDPNVPNYGVAGSGPKLSAGLTIAIEPMATLGDWQVNILDDGWTVVTRDGTLAAHFEHTVLITDDGAEILTQL